MKTKSGKRKSKEYMSQKKLNKATLQKGQISSSPWTIKKVKTVKHPEIENNGDGDTHLESDDITFKELQNIGYLIQNLLNCDIKIGTQRINKLINCLMDLIELGNEKKKPKTCTLVSTLATTAGATYEDVVPQGFWFPDRNSKCVTNFQGDQEIA
ncbi:hypothetical protein BB560_002515 [Smittium megazygosporum]|uniref:Uncharacterized protein n=1 Tax=Smittium megazygosporum TaxID=133381 RepID=A0A2T9ZEP3_9FUNG|nr:hypothetical protein BB560_002515 [Smittium megazygosporum]